MDTLPVIEQTEYVSYDVPLANVSDKLINRLNLSYEEEVERSLANPSRTLETQSFDLFNRYDKRRPTDTLEASDIPLTTMEELDEIDNLFDTYIEE